MKKLLLIVLLGAFSDCKCESVHRDTEKATAIRAQVLEALAFRLAECAPTSKDSVRPLLQLEPMARFDIGKALSDGRIRLAAEQAEACLGFIKTSSCDTARTSFSSPGSPCAKLFVPQGKARSACMSDVDCGSGLFCNVDELHCPGVCQQKGLDKQSCDDRTPCERGFACTCADNNCKEKLCQQLSRTGMRCDSLTTPPCADDHFCVPLGLNKARTCQPRQKNGDPCVSVDGCIFPNRCSNGTCRRPRMIGEACVPGAGECTDLSVCKVQRGAAQCVPWGTTGSACGLVNDGKEYAGCVGSACALDPKTAQGVCQPYKADGEACSAGQSIDFVCGPGRCDVLMHRCVYPCDARSK